MKEIGMVKKYNGYDGVIINNQGEEFILLNSNIKDNYKVTNDSKVLFVPEHYKQKLKIARFVTPIKGAVMK